MAAGLATLRHADDAVYAALDANAERLAGLLAAALTEAGVAHQVPRAGNFLSVFFTDSPVTDFAAARPARPGGSRRSSTPCWTPASTRASAFETWFVSAALDDAAFERIAAALPAAARAAAEAKP